MNEALRTGRRDGESGGEHGHLVNALAWHSRACVTPPPVASRKWACLQVAVLLGTVITQGPGAHDNMKKTAFYFRRSGSESSDGNIRKRRACLEKVALCSPAFRGGGRAGRMALPSGPCAL